MAFTTERSVAIGSVEETEVRNAVSSWANSIPHHPHRNLGEKVSIVKIDFNPVYQITLQTQFHSSGDTVKIRAYGNGMQYADGGTKAYHVTRPSFSRDTVSYTVPGSERIQQCGTCKGNGKTTCSSCGGSRRTRCNSCNGSGLCHSCGGRGTQRCNSCGGSGQTRNGDQWQRCNSCGASGQTFCTHCLRSGRCQRCQGGYVSCGTCGATGQVTCHSCNGYGKVIEYTERTEKWDYTQLTAYAISPDAAEAFEEIRVHNNPTHTVVSENKAALLPVNAYDTEPSFINSAYKELLKKGVVPAGLNLHHNARVLEQAVHIGKIDTYHVCYSHAQESFHLLMFIRDKQVYEEDGPVIRVKKELIGKAKRSFKRKNFGRSAADIQKAHEMGIDTGDTETLRIKEKIEQKIRSSYRIGAILGALTVCYFLSLWVISYFSRPWYAIPFLEKTAASWGNGFTLVNNLFLCACCLWLGIVHSKRITNSLFDTAAIKIKPEPVRMLGGFIGIVPYNLFSMFTLLLLNATGILLPFTFTIYQLLKIVIRTTGYHNLYFLFQ